MVAAESKEESSSSSSAVRTDVGKTSMASCSAEGPTLAGTILALVQAPISEEELKDVEEKEADRKTRKPYTRDEWYTQDAYKKGAGWCAGDQGMGTWAGQADSRNACLIYMSQGEVGVGDAGKFVQTVDKTPR
jgi:hypothetical protein